MPFAIEANTTDVYSMVVLGLICAKSRCRVSGSVQAQAAVARAGINETLSPPDAYSTRRPAPTMGWSLPFRRSLTVKHYLFVLGMLWLLAAAVSFADAQEVRPTRRADTESAHAERPNIVLFLADDKYVSPNSKSWNCPKINGNLNGHMRSAQYIKSR